MASNDSQPDREDGAIPDTVEGMLAQLSGSDGIDIDAMRELGRGFGALYAGALAEADNPMAALGLAGAWIAAMVEHGNADDGE